MLGLVEISVGERAPDDLVDAGEDDVVERGQRDQRLRKALLVPRVGHPSLHVGAVEALDGLVDVVLRGREDGYVRARLKEGLGRPVSDPGPGVKFRTAVFR